MKDKALILFMAAGIAIKQMVQIELMDYKCFRVNDGRYTASP